MDRRAFVTAMASMVAGGGLAHASDEERRLDRLYRVTTALVLRYYPHAKTELSQHTIHFESGTRRFMMHEQLKTGEWQDAHETTGAQRGGVVGDMELRAGKYLGAAVVPRPFDKRAFPPLVMAPSSGSPDAHLPPHLPSPA